MTKTNQLIECVDAGDGSGDLMIEIPQGVLVTLDLKAGDTLVWTVAENGEITMKKRAQPSDQ